MKPAHISRASPSGTGSASWAAADAGTHEQAGSGSVVDGKQNRSPCQLQPCPTGVAGAVAGVAVIAGGLRAASTCGRGMHRTVGIGRPNAGSWCRPDREAGDAWSIQQRQCWDRPWRRLRSGCRAARARRWAWWVRMRARRRATWTCDGLARGGWTRRTTASRSRAGC